MYSSDEDEDETLPSPVDNYHFEDDKKEPVSLSVLPVQWTASSESADSEAKIFIQGDADNKLIKVYKPVVAWRFDLSNVKPEISVLLKGKQQWIKLAKPRKSYEETIRSVLVTVNCLHFVTRNPESSAKSLWDSLCKDYGSFEVRPSESDLADHISLITEAVKRDNALEKSKFLADFLKGKPGKRRPAEETKAKSRTQFIVSDSDDDGMGVGGEGDESDEEDEMFDSACAICDNGGDLLCCEGSCLRSFHPSPDEDENCESLGFTEEQVQATPQFLCKNCEYKQHQCFACGKLGSSDKYSGAEVFQCVSATCGYFFHPRCIAKLIHEDDKCSTEELEKKIKAGESFTCPAHKCSVCKQGENKKDKELQFAVCRRCPSTYHRKCLPEEIPFQNEDDDEVVPRAWEGLLPNRILIYCLKHEIDENFGTPSRNHIIFPGAEEEKKKKKNTSAKRKTITEGKRPKQEDKKRIDTIKERKTAQFKDYKKQFPALKVEARANSGKKLGSGDGSLRKVKVNALAKKNLTSQGTKRNKQSIGNKLFALISKDSEAEDEDSSDDEFDKAVEVPLNADSEQRVLDIMKTVESEITMKDIKARLKVPLTNQSSQKQCSEEKTVSVMKVENMVQAVKAALEHCQKRGNIEDAKAVCGPDVIKNILKWRGKYKFYLSPFLHGMRYTSFGRHFTNPVKLKEIADKLQWYAKDGDMVVDFCCGSNDFSVFMEKKLRELGKKCSFKNYDIIPTGNDFNFEKRDWGTVDPRELPNGSKLIMGLNPPFGIRGAKANVFIDKALQFKPKLIILIVPEETERLDEKETPYDLIWEDREMLAGKSFYLPGSTDVNERTMAQWNYRAPPLYLWSRKDWTNTHKRIAEKHGHISKLRRDKAIMERSDHRIDSDDDDFADMDEYDIVLPELDYPKGREPERKGRESPPQTGGHGKNKPIDKSSSRKRANSQRNQGWQQNKRKVMDSVPTELNYDSVRDLHSPRTRISPPYAVPPQNHNSVRDFRSPRVISPPYSVEQNYDDDNVGDFHSPRILPHYTSGGPSNTDHRDEPYEPGSPSQFAGRRFGDEAHQRYASTRQPRIETENFPSSSMSARAPSQDYLPGRRGGRQRTPPIRSSLESEIPPSDRMRHRSSPPPMASFYDDANVPPISAVYESGGPVVGPPGVIWPPGRAEMMHRTSISAWASEPPRMYGGDRRFEPGPGAGPPPLAYPPGSYPRHGSGGWLDYRPPGF